MAGNNRYLAGKTSVMRVPIRGSTVVDPGDLMMLNRGAAQSGGVFVSGRVTDNYGYPFGSMSSSCGQQWRIHAAYTEFCGVAIGGSISGVTEDIGVATAGQYRYPLQTGSGGVTTSNVTAGMLVSASSPPRNQQIRPGAANLSSSAYIGYCTKRESGASFIDFFIRTSYGPAGKISQ